MGILYGYVIDKKPRSEDSQKKKITQLDKEYNIDIYNLFKGGLLTQFYKDKVYSIGETKDIEEEFKEYSERIETIKKKIDDFLKVIEEQNPEKFKRIEGFGKSRRRFGSTTGENDKKKNAEEKENAKEQNAEEQENTKEKDDKDKFKELTNKIFDNQKNFSDKFM